MKEPCWLDRALVDLFQEDQIRTHGGPYGVRDSALLESALARPRQRYEYDPQADLATLAASLGFGLARNHPYLDGNKRVAFLAMAVFLDLNGGVLAAEEGEVVAVLFDLAAGELSEADLARWLRLRTTAR